MKKSVPHRIETIASKLMVGQQLSMSLVENRTGELFKSFMPRRMEISHQLNEHVFDLKIYPEEYFQTFNPANPFTKWALVEVSELSDLPADMESFILPEGLYAVFTHRGPSSDTSTFQYIFSEWLPKAVYQLDNRPHFDLMGDNYKLNHPDSEEEIWVPIRK